VRKFLDDALQAALTGQMSAKKAMEDAQAQARRVLRRYQ
jgi:sn-glycerol 3-phosphate transport system substrate-binding protein